MGRTIVWGGRFALMALAVGVWAAPAESAKVPKADYAIARSGLFPPIRDAAMSPLAHPGAQIFLATGGVFHDRELFMVRGGAHARAFELRYLSGVAFDGPFGRNWWSSFHALLEPQPNGDVVFHDDEGRASTFTANGNDYDAPNGLYARLEAIRKGRKNKIKGWLLTFADRSIWEFDKKGRWVRWTRPDGQIVKLSRDRRHALRRIKTPEKRKYVFKYGKDRRLSQIKLPAKRKFTFRYDAEGHLVGIARPQRTGDAAPPTFTYDYDANDRLTSVVNSDGRTTCDITYDGVGRCIRVEDEHDIGASFDYSEPGAVVTDGSDDVTRRYEYDGNGRLTAWRLGATDDVPAITSYTYDGLGRLSTVTDRIGGIETFTYDNSTDPIELGNVVIHEDAPPTVSVLDPRETRTTYLEGTNIPVLVEANDDVQVRKVEFVFPGAGNSDAGATMKITLPPVETEAGPVTPVVTRIFDDRGRLIEVEDADGSLSRFEYGTKKGETDLVVREIIGAGSGVDPVTGKPYPNRINTFDYDAAGNLIRKDEGAGVETRYRYDAWDNLVGVERGGIESTLTYDAAGRVVRRARPFLDVDGDPVGTTDRVETFVRDALGRILEERHADGFGNERVVEYAYSDLSARPSVLTSPNGTVQRNEYDGLGRLVRVRRGVGTPQEQNETITYDDLSNDRVIDRGDQGVIRETRNAFDEMEFRTDALDRTTIYTYDAVGRVLSRTVQDDQGADQSRERYLYDAAGNRIVTERDRFDPTDPGAGNETEITREFHNVRGFPEVRIGPVGDRTEYVYDAAGQVVCINEPELGKQTLFDYDPAGRLVTRTKVLGPGTQGEMQLVERFTWDDLTRLTSFENAAGATTRFEYDSLDNGTRVVRPDATTTTDLYDALGRRTRTETANPGLPGATKVSTFTYDPAGNLTATTGPSGVTETYVYDPLNRITQHTRGGQTVAAYTYDGAGRVATRTDGAGVTITWAYDPVGRVLSRTPSNGSAQTFTWDGNDRMATGIDGSSGTSNIGVLRKFDSLGNLLLDGQPGGQVQRSWGPGHTPRTLQSPDGFTYGFTNDFAGRVTGMTRDGNAYGTTVHVPGTRKPAFQSSPGVSTSYEYDLLGRRTQVRADAAGASQPDSTSDATYDGAGRLISLTREDGRGERWEYDALGRMTAHYTNAVAPASGTPTVFGTATRYTYDASHRITAIETIDGAAPTMAKPAKVASLTYDVQGRPITIDGQNLTYAGAGHATNWYENRPAHDAGERRIEMDAFGRITRVVRASNQTVLGQFLYDVLNRPVIAVEEEFTGNVSLSRRRVFAGCRLIAELSPTPNTGFDGFDLFFVPDPSSNGWLANGFKDSFFSELFHQTDCRGMQMHGYDAVNMQHNESFQHFSPQGLPYFEFPAGTPWRGAPSLNSVVNAQGLASASIAGVVFNWFEDSDDPFLPRKLTRPADRLGPFGLPRPGGPVPGPVVGDPNGDEDDDWVDTSPDPEDVDSSCEDAVAELERLLGYLGRLEGAAFRANQDLYDFQIWRSAKQGKLDAVQEGLDEILEGQQRVRDRIDFLRGLDTALTAVDEIAGAAGEVKDAYKNFKDMGEGMRKTASSKGNSRRFDDGVEQFVTGATFEAGRQIGDSIRSFNRGLVYDAIQDTVTGGNELGLSEAGAIGYNIASKVNGLFGGMTLKESLAEFDRLFGIGLESRKSLSEDLARLDRAIADRKAFLDEVRAAAAGACARAQQALDTLAEVWGEADAAPFRQRLADLKADLARQGVR